MPHDRAPAPHRAPYPEGRSCCAPLTQAALSDDDAGRLAQVFKALADPARLKLLSMIGVHDGGEVCVCELIEGFSLTAPTISHHLRVLRESGLITSDRRGTWVYYRLLPQALADLAGLLAIDEVAAAQEA